MPISSASNWVCRSAAITASPARYAGRLLTTLLNSAPTAPARSAPSAPGSAPMSVPITVSRPNRPMVCTTRNSPVTNTSSRHGTSASRSRCRARTAKPATRIAAATPEATPISTPARIPATNSRQAASAVR